MASLEPAPRPKGSFNLRFAGVFFILSALFEAFMLTSRIPLFGELRGGALALLVHLAYAALFAALAFALLKQKPWGPRLTLVATLLVTVDRLLYMFDEGARRAELLRAVEGYPEVLELVGESTFLSMMILMAAVTLTCWWGFAAYVYLRRSYFAPVSHPETP